MAPENTLHSLIDIARSALTVRAMATTAPTMWCPDPDDPVVAVRDRMEGQDFDFALLQRERPFKFIARADLSTEVERVAEVAQPVTTSELVTSNLGVADTLELLANHEFLFLLERDEVVGLVTRADLQKPAASMVTFAFILGIEMGLRGLIAEEYGPTAWIERLAPDKAAEVRETFVERRRTNSEISLLDCLTTSASMSVLVKSPELRSRIGVSRGESERLSGRITVVRNDLAHGRDLLSSTPEAEKAIARFLCIRDLANRLAAACGRLET